MNPPGSQHHGFDAAVMRREDDHLNRWQFAREIYGIATTGPRDWSVRIGIYGEWGTGKTSVLEFITVMAQRDRQIVVRFNPWEHSTKDSLWRAFVLAVFKEPALAKIAGGTKARAKGWFGGILKRTNAVESGFAVWNEKVGKGVGVGLDLVKSFFAFNENDLKSLRDVLGDKRVIVLVDDLDRTAPELVPEILFAFKELMNIPGFSFICAFDPVVVGKVLRQHHRGFGDGLKFLEKIIDYPRWLPLSPPDGLVKLAIADAKRFCKYVPEDALRDTVPLLPPNPRAIRQFVRLLALLHPQIERHYDHELRWDVILAANVLKIRHPHIAPALLGKKSFWKSVEVIALTLNGEKEGEEISKTIGEHLKRVATEQGVSLKPDQQKEIEIAMTTLCSQVNMWIGRGAEEISNQMNVAEAPHAVTWKEFDRFVGDWQRKQTAATAQAWLVKHADEQERSQPAVYRELFSATLHRYANALHQADNVLTEAEKQTFVEKADLMIVLLECLVFELGGLDQDEKRIGAKELELLFEKFWSIISSSSPVHSTFRQRNEAFVLRLIEQWSGDLTPLVRAVHPYEPYQVRHFEGPAAKALHQRLCEAVLPKYAKQAAEGFRKPGFVSRLLRHDTDTYDLRCMVLNPKSSLWGTFRAEMLKVFKEASSNKAVRENANQFLLWCDDKLCEGPQDDETTNLKKLFSEKEIVNAVWSAAVATPLSPIAVAHLQRLPNTLKALGISVTLPPWWESTLATFTPALKDSTPT